MKNDNNQMGHIALNVFLVEVWQYVKINQKVLEVMEEKEFDLYTVIKCHKALEVCGLQLHSVHL